MKKRDAVIERVRRANPVALKMFVDLPTSKEGQLTAAAIAEEPVRYGRPHSWIAARPLRRTGPLLIAVGAACATVAAIVAINGTDSRKGSHTVWAAELVRFAEASPRLLLDTEGWIVTRADELSHEEGEMTFSNGADEADLHWRPSDTHQTYVEDRRADAHASWPITIDGVDGVLVQYKEGSSFTALWRHDGRSLEFRADTLGTKEAFENLAASLHEVDVDTWLSAMPESVIRPDSRAATVEEMLEDIPVPDSVDVSKLKRGDVVSDEYQLGALVTGAVTCGWIDQWIVANRSGDTAARDEAVAALASTRDWDVLNSMQRQGDWSEVLWSYADAIVAEPQGAPSVVAGYGSGLGCGYKLEE
jgi:hypothetical protein